MGCGKSTQTHSVDDEDDLVITREGQVNGNKTEQVKIEGIEATENSSQDSGQNGYHPPDRPVIQKNRQIRPRKFQSRREIENAWGVSKAKTNIIEDVTEKPKGQMLRDMDFKSEYGRDGVDMSSTYVGNDTDKLVHTSLVKRTSPDGMHFTKYSEVTKNPRTLHKAESEEEFDPSAVIDIAKFKAANAPSKQTAKASNDSEAAEDGNDNDPTHTTKINTREVKILTTPSNYNEFYDDDEKQLIESIENDFHSTSLPVLPGSVI